MKTIKEFLALALVGGALASPLEAQSSLDAGLVAFYPFNGNANDASGGGNNGTVDGAILATDRLGQVNSAYRFDGVNDRINFNFVPLTQVDNWTLSAWINPASFSQTGIAVMVGAQGSGLGQGSDGYGFGFQGNATGQRFFLELLGPAAGSSCQRPINGITALCCEQRGRPNFSLTGFKPRSHHH